MTDRALPFDVRIPVPELSSSPSALAEAALKELAAVCLRAIGAAAVLPPEAAVDRLFEMIVMGPEVAGCGRPSTVC